MRKIQGTCKLTGRVGAYVDSHLIPLSLTRISFGGRKIVEAELGSPEKLRFQGWYDNELVIRAGEDILAAIDCDGISQLRRHKLIWSSFPEGFVFSDMVCHGALMVRMVELGDAKELRLFFVSLLWRISVSTRHEFFCIKLSDATTQDLASRLLAGNPGNANDYPVQLFQLVTKGLVHNRTPIYEHKTVVDEFGRAHGEVEYVRFYLDGLVAHVHVASSRAFPAVYASTFIGSQPTSVVFAHSFERSRTFENIKELLSGQAGL